MAAAEEDVEASIINVVDLAVAEVTAVLLVNSLRFRCTSCLHLTVLHH